MFAYRTQVHVEVVEFVYIEYLGVAEVEIFKKRIRRIPVKRDPAGFPRIPVGVVFMGYVRLKKEGSAFAYVVGFAAVYELSAAFDRSAPVNVTRGRLPSPPGHNILKLLLPIIFPLDNVVVPSEIS